MRSNICVDPDVDPISLLVRCSLLNYFRNRIFRLKKGIVDATDDGGSLLKGLDNGELKPDDTILASFPEFCSHLKDSSRMPPVIRLTSWILYNYRSLKDDINLGDRLSANLKILRKLIMIDQPRFPLVTGLSSIQTVS